MVGAASPRPTPEFVAITGVSAEELAAFEKEWNAKLGATDNTSDSHCYHLLVKQLISRIDDDLHRRLKERAAQEGRSLNDLVAALLADAVADRRESFRRRLERSGLRTLPPVPMQQPPTLDEVLAMPTAARAPR